MSSTTVSSGPLGETGKGTFGLRVPELQNGATRPIWARMEYLVATGNMYLRILKLPSQKLEIGCDLTAQPCDGAGTIL